MSGVSEMNESKKTCLRLSNTIWRGHGGDAAGQQGPSSHPLQLHLTVERCIFPEHVKHLHPEYPNAEPKQAAKRLCDVKVDPKFDCSTIHAARAIRSSSLPSGDLLDGMSETPAPAAGEAGETAWSPFLGALAQGMGPVDGFALLAIAAPKQAASRGQHSEQSSVLCAATMPPARCGAPGAMPAASAFCFKDWLDSVPLPSSGTDALLSAVSLPAGLAAGGSDVPLKLGRVSAYALPSGRGQAAGGKFATALALARLASMEQGHLRK